MKRKLLTITLSLTLCACATSLPDLHADQAKLCPALPPRPVPAGNPNQQPMLEWLKSLPSPSSTTPSNVTTTTPHGSAGIAGTTSS